MGVCTPRLEPQTRAYSTACADQLYQLSMGLECIQIDNYGLTTKEHPNVHHLYRRINIVQIQKRLSRDATFIDLKVILKLDLTK